LDERLVSGFPSALLEARNHIRPVRAWTWAWLAKAAQWIKAGKYALNWTRRSGQKFVA
jgi:hypothetical protein